MPERMRARPARGSAALTGVKVTAEGTTLNVGTISFPAAAGTATNPLAGLGVPTAAQLLWAPSQSTSPKGA